MKSVWEKLEEKFGTFNAAVKKYSSWIQTTYFAGVFVENFRFALNVNDFAFNVINFSFVVLTFYFILLYFPPEFL